MPKKLISTTLYLVFFFLFNHTTQAQVLLKTENYQFGTSGYLRTGIGASEGDNTQAHFQMPGALNKFSLGNQADTYGELEFDYSHFFGQNKDKSIDASWMVSIYEDFGTDNQMSFNKTEQLYAKANNLFGKNMTLWIGERFYDRKAIHLLDRQWINPGQAGPGIGIENILTPTVGDEDLRFAFWRFQDDDVVSFCNGNRADLTAFTFDARWVLHPLSETTKLSVAANYSLRSNSSTMEYDTKHGFGLFSWLDYKKNNIENTVAVLFRYGATVSINHWTGVPEKENPGNDNIIRNDLNNSYTLEINNNFLYDDFDRFAINGIFLGLIRDYGTEPLLYTPPENPQPGDAMDPNNYQPAPGLGTGRMLYWLSVGARGMYYVCKQFRLVFESTYEYVNNKQEGVEGSLGRFAFTPEFALRKGFYDRPVLRPFVSYALWSDDLRGHIGNVPNGAPYGNNTDGFNYGLQFEIWW